MTVEPIPREELDRAVRTLCRNVAAALIQGMAETDTSFAMIAVKLGVTEKTVRGWIDDLMDGIEGKTTMRVIAEMCWAMGCVPQFSVNPK